MNKIKTLYLLITIMVFTLPGYGQQTQEKFGRNRIQYTEFDWKFLSSDNFEVYYYAGGGKIAKEISEFLEQEFDRITDLIGYPPYTKTKLFLYNSVSDLHQSNVGIGEGTFEPGGETQFVKPNIEVANPGNIAALKQELLTKVSSLMVNEMMFGGSLKDMFQSAVLLNLPEWFIEGAALYVAQGWSIEMDDYVRELVNTKSARKFNRLRGKEAALAGQSLWNFIAHKYGRSNISNILNYTRIIRNQEKSIAITLGISFEQLMLEWQNFYIDNDRQVKQNYLEINKELSLTGGKNKKRIVYDHVKISPDGTQVAYTKNDNGRYTVIIQNVTTRKETEVLKGGYRVIGQQVDYGLPILDWADDNTLGIIHSKNGQMNFVLYDLQTKSKLPRVLNRLDQVKSMEFSENGRLVIVSAVVQGRNDLYLLSTRRDRTKRLTNDVYDDLSPSFIPNTNSIVFSSNRVSDTLDTKENNIESVSDNFNLFYYNLDTTKNVLHRVTNTISKDTKPIALDGNKIFYLSDQKGIINIFSYDVSSGIYAQVTNFSGSIKNFDLDFKNSQLAFVSSIKGRDLVYFDGDFNYNQQIFTPQTLRQQVLQVQEFKAKRQAKSTEGLTIEQIVEQRLANKKKEKEMELNKDSLLLSGVQDSTNVVRDPNIIDTDNYSFDTEPEPEVLPTTDEEEIVNTDNYVFDEDILRAEKTDSFLAQYRQTREGKRISGPFPYQSRFSFDNLLTSFVIDPLRGFGILLNVEMNDMLENHKFSGGVMTQLDFKSGDIYAEYQYLKSRVDFNVRYDRSVIFWENEFSLHQYSKNSFEAGASLPLSTKARISVKPFYMVTRFEDQVPTSVNSPVKFVPIQSDQYLGGTAEFVYDNSIINGMNLIEGTRAKVSLRHYEGVNSKENSFSNFHVDLRHYQKIHREIVFATKLYYGSFFGRSPKKYLLGGMDNWAFRRVNRDGKENPLQERSGRSNYDLLFTEFATNLRGFAYAELYGNNVLVFNAELRIPIIRYLSGGPISSNFFRNLQFTGFYDIGSSWTGKSPFNKDNRISNEVISEGAFTIDLHNYRNPWLYSYGVGLRTMLLGYYVKLDMAWPVEDYIANDPRFQFTLGYDF
ncbi:MAG TPA: translocation protein TolB [Fulvivirga sp.]|nr:translocation protein TolB [Fulvivirga sp.]